MSNVIGIDLGTTYSTVARITRDGRSEIVRDEDGHNLTPSVVVRERKDAVHVGWEAKREGDIRPEVCFKEFKREMGTDQTWKIEDEEFTPVVLSSLVLRKLKMIAESQLGSIDEAVITVPANFAHQARQDTITAGSQIGLNVKHIINEPTAAALCYAMLEDLQGTVAVYDLGGGTFDCSIVKLAGKDTEVLCSQGSQRLGGVDFDQKLLELISAKFRDAIGSAYDVVESDLKQRPLEEYKKSLSKRDAIKVLISTEQHPPTNVDITRSEFENAISTYITKAQMLVELALSEIDLTPDDIDHVLLVGGSTRIPAVRTSVESIFGKAPKALRNVDEVVALGAAYYAILRTDSSSLNAAQKAAFDNVTVSEKTSHFFGTQIIEYNDQLDRYDHRVSILIPKNADIPCSVTERYYTTNDGQQYVNCSVSQSTAEETDPQWVTKIWEGRLGPFPANRPAGQEIRVTFNYDTNSTLTCEFTDVATGMKTEKALNLRSEEQSTAIDVDQFIVE